MKHAKWNSLQAAALLFLGAMVLSGRPAQGSFLITGELAASSPTNYFIAELPQAAVDNSGITINTPDLNIDGAITHKIGANGANEGWIGGDGTFSVVGMTLTIDLGTTYDLDGMRIWNYNGFAGTDCGIRLYDLETSPNGTTWTLRQNDQFLPVAPNVNDIPSDNTFDGVYTAADWDGTRYVRLTIVQSWRGNQMLGGLSEIMFSTIPEPSTALLIGIGGLVAFRQRRRG